MNLPGRILDRKREDGTWSNRHHKEWGDTCIDCQRPADYVVQGETDSFGYEANALCKEHYDRERKIPNTGECEWCPTPQRSLATIGDLLGVTSPGPQPTEVQLYPTRDYDEGLHGPVYWVCKSCLQRQAERLREVEVY